MGVIRKLGQGHFGVVMEVASKSTPEQHLAMKVIPMANLEDAGRFAKELAVARRLKHPHIIRLHETFKEGEKYHLVMDFSDGGDLFEKLQSTEREKDDETIVGVDSDQVAKFAWQMLTGIGYLHHYSFAHRDVKPQNYLLDRSGTSLKLIDFGLSRSCSRGEKMTTRVGTPHYVAPEVIDNEVHGYGLKCDMWSIAVTLWVTSVGEVPFEGEGQQDVLRNVVRGAYKFKSTLWNGLHGHPRELQDLLAELLVREPEDRPSAKIILARNSWLKQHAPPGNASAKSCCMAW